jgi:hypothetical protein
MKSKYTRLSFAKVKTSSITERYSKVNIDDFAQPVDHQTSITEFLDSLPEILSAKELKEFISHYKNAVRQKKIIVWMMGAHTIKCGLNPVIIKLMER